MRGNHRTFRLGALALALAAPAVPSTAHAGGLFVPGLGPVAQARAGADVASVDDPSGIATNPAALAETEGTVLLVGSDFLGYSLGFTRRGVYDATDNANPWEGTAYPHVTNDAAKPPIGVGSFQALPMIAVAFDLTKQVTGLHVGVGLFVPTSYPTRDMGSDYQLPVDSIDETTAPPPGRYDIVTQEAAIMFPSLVAAYKVNDKISVGGRFSWGLANLKATTFTWGQYPNYEEWAQHDSFFKVEAKDNFAPAFGLGIQAHLTPAIDVGANWDSGLSAHTKGTGTADAGYGLRFPPTYDPVVIEPVDDSVAKCAKGGAVGALKACVNIALPMITTVGGRYRLNDASGAQKGDVELDVAWERWSAASDYTVTVDGVASGLNLNPTIIRHNFQDVISVRLGGSYQLPVGAGLLLQGGLAYDTAAAPKGWERLDIDGAARTTVGLGVGYPVTSKIDVALGYGYTYEGSRTNDNPCNPAPGNVGCAGTGTDTSFYDRGGPDPAQPLTSGDPFESPFNAGTYESSYMNVSLTMLAKF